MNPKELTDSQIENLLELVDELQWKLKKKNAQLTAARTRLNNAKRSIRRLRDIVAYQRERILTLYGKDVLGPGLSFSNDHQRRID